MPEVDPVSLSRFASASAALAGARDHERVTDLHIATNPSDRDGVYRRLRRSPTPIGAMFRGMEAEIGSEPALEVIAALIERQAEGGAHAPT